MNINNSYHFFLEDLKKKETFSFIKDRKTQELAYHFLSYVYSLSEECISINQDDETIIELKAHTMSIYIGSIIEWILYYFVDTLYKDKKSREKYLKNIELKKIQKIDLEEKTYYFCEEKEKQIKITDTINFNSLIHGVRHNQILDQKIIDKINNVREIRNAIHINVYKHNEKVKFNEITTLLQDAKEIIDTIEEKLKNS